MLVTFWMIKKSLESCGIQDGSTLHLILLPPSEVRVSSKKSSALVFGKMRRFKTLLCSGEPDIINLSSDGRKVVPELGQLTAQEAPIPILEPEDQEHRSEGGGECKDRIKRSTFGKAEAAAGADIKPRRFGVKMVPRLGPNHKKVVANMSGWQAFAKDINKAPMQIPVEPEPSFGSLLHMISSRKDALSFVAKHSKYLALYRPMQPSAKIQSLLALAGIDSVLTRCSDVGAILFQNVNCHCAIVTPDGVYL